MNVETDLTQHKVEVSFSFTYNLGNYNSLKISATVGDYINTFEEFGCKFDKMVTDIRMKVLQSIKETVKKLKGDCREVTNG